MTMTDTPAAATVIALDNLPTPALLALADRYKDPSELELVLTERLRSAWDELARMRAERADQVAA